MNKKQIITIQGVKNSGKDETAKYILYLLNNPKFLHYYWIGKLLNFKTFYNKWKINKYASILKKMLAVLINVDEKRFEDRDFKEYYYFDFNSYSLLHETSVPDEKKLSDKAFNKELKKGNQHIATDYVLSMRQLLQFFGTEIMRNYFGDSLWTLATLKSPLSKMVISDQRFIIENTTSKKFGAFIIHVDRPGCEIGLHSSERQLVELLQQKKYDVLLKNNGSLKDLFNNCKKIIYDWNKIL